jgi:L-cysteine S-thiosulfotransferase
MTRTHRITALVATLILLAAGCATLAGGDSVQQATVAAMKQSFETKGQATVERLDQDLTQAACTRYAAEKLPPAVASQIEADNLATVRFPADGKYLGNWKEGEKIAQTGVGKQWSDDPAKPSGGNCYACHQLSKEEIAYGTIGPSLYHYGKLRGTSEAIMKVTWTKIFNSNAYSACSNMPRFGHMDILTEAQLKDVMALLLDPASPVNQ